MKPSKLTLTVIAAGLTIALIYWLRITSAEKRVAEQPGAAARALSAADNSARRERPAPGSTKLSHRILEDPLVTTNIYDEKSLLFDLEASDPDHRLIRLVAAGKFAEARDWILSRPSRGASSEALYLWHAWAAADRDAAAAALADRNIPADVAGAALRGIFSTLYQSPGAESVAWMKKLSSGFDLAENTPLYLSVSVSWLAAGVLDAAEFSTWMDHLPPDQKAAALAGSFGSSLAITGGLLTNGNVSRGQADLLNSGILAELREIGDPPKDADQSAFMNLSQGLASTGLHSGEMAGTMNRVEASFAAYDLPASLILQSNFAAGLGRELRGSQDIDQLVQLANSDQVLGGAFWNEWVRNAADNSDPLAIESRLASAAMPEKLAHAAGEILAGKTAGRENIEGSLDSLPTGPFRDSLIAALIAERRRLGQPTASLEARTGSGVR